MAKIAEEDTAKLRQVLQYLEHTIDDKRIMGIDSISQLYTRVDATYAVHPNLKRHTSGCISFVYGMLHHNSRNQRMNTKSSTKEKIFGVSDCLPYNLFFKIWAQGYNINQIILFQDNQSSMKI